MAMFFVDDILFRQWACLKMGVLPQNCHVQQGEWWKIMRKGWLMMIVCYNYRILRYPIRSSKITKVLQMRLGRARGLINCVDLSWSSADCMDPGKFSERVSDGFPREISIDFLWVSDRGFRWVSNFRWVANGGFLWVSCGFPMGFRWVVNGGFLWVSDGFPMLGFRLVFDGFLMDFW